MEPTVEALLQAITEDPAPVELLDAYGPDRYPDLWNKDGQGPRLYRGCARTLIDRGFPTFGLKLGRRGLEACPHDPQLLYTVALAHARGGNVTSAEQTLEELLTPKPEDTGPTALPLTV